MLFGQITGEGRLLVDLIAVHVLVLGFLGLSVLLRWLVTHSSHRLARWAGTERLKQFSDEATRHGHTMLFWLTVTAMALTVLGGIGYHLLGRDVRDDVAAWCHQLTPQHLLHFGLALGGLAILAIVTSGVVRVLRRVLPLLESQALARLGHPKNEATLKR